MTRLGGRCGGLCLLLHVVLCVPSASLPIRPNAPREEGERSVVPMPAASNLTRPGVLPATTARLGFEARGDVNVSSWWRRASAPWSLAPYPPEVVYQFHAVPDQDESSAGGDSAVFVGVVGVLALIGCCVFCVQLDDGGIFSPGRVDDATKRQFSQSPLTQQSLSMRPRDSGGAEPSRNSLAFGASALNSSLPSRLPSAAALLEPGPPRRVLASTTQPMPLATPALLAPVVTKRMGEVFLMHGTALNGMQESTNIRIVRPGVRPDTSEPYALIHINENAYGCGVLVEIPPQQAIAFFDTQCADVHVSCSPRSRRVSILRADSQGWDPTAEPVVVVAPSFVTPGTISVSQHSWGNAPLFQVKLGADGQATRVTAGSDGTEVISMLEADPHHSDVRRLFVNCGVDPLLILCSVVAAIKIGVR